MIVTCKDIVNVVEEVKMSENMSDQQQQQQQQHHSDYQMPEYGQVEANFWQC